MVHNLAQSLSKKYGTSVEKFQSIFAYLEVITMHAIVPESVCYF